jgi:NADPH:quinone reductase-like Zn-dependent oxidoreductase
MKAIVGERYGAPERLRLEDVPEPALKDGWVLLKVRAASLNAMDWHTVRGTPYLARGSMGLTKPSSAVPGGDLAGVVEAVGAGVTRFSPGDRVFGTKRGSLAEYACAPEIQLAHMPASASFEQAATLPIAGVTALQALRDRGQVTGGTRVLVNGAGGGVGTFTVQLAAAMGAEVTAVCGTHNVELVRSLGAREVIDYSREDFNERDTRYEVIIDNVSTRRLSSLRRVLEPEGILVVIGGAPGNWVGPMVPVAKAALANIFTKQSLGFMMAKVTPEDLDVLARHLADGTVVPVIDRVVTLADAPAALSYLEQGHARGKVVVNI